MSKDTKIEWANLGLERAASWNPIYTVDPANGDKRGWACVKVDGRCENCYAEVMNKRWGTGLPYSVSGFDQVEPRLSTKGDSAITAPFEWRKRAGVFVGSMTDLFVQTKNGGYKREWLNQIFATMLCTPWHRYAILTKHPDRLADYLESLTRVELSTEIINLYERNGWTRSTEIDGVSYHSPLESMRFFSTEPYFSDRHIAIGFSSGTQRATDEALPYMHAIREQYPEAILWTSNEPCLEKINWQGWEKILDWVVTGGESGATKAIRPLHPEWVRSDRGWCLDHGVRFFFKQWGEFKPVPEIKIYGKDGSYPFGDNQGVARIGKNRSGHVLDGHTYHQYPQAWDD